MNQLVVIKQGRYDDDGQLNDCDLAKLGKLAARVKQAMEGATVLIVTSPVDRDRESGEILKRAFEVGVEECEVLWLGNFFPEDFPGTLELIREYQNEAEVLVLVTHYEHEYENVKNFSEYFAREKMKVPLGSRPNKNGEAWVLNILEKSLLHVVP